jgi:hypothetical protein
VKPEGEREKMKNARANGPVSLTSRGSSPRRAASARASTAWVSAGCGSMPAGRGGETAARPTTSAARRKERIKLSLFSSPALHLKAHFSIHCALLFCFPLHPAPSLRMQALRAIARALPTPAAGEWPLRVCQTARYFFVSQSRHCPNLSLLPSSPSSSPQPARARAPSRGGGPAPRCTGPRFRSSLTA